MEHLFGGGQGDIFDFEIPNSVDVDGAIPSNLGSERPMKFPPPLGFEPMAINAMLSASFQPDVPLSSYNHIEEIEEDNEKHRSDLASFPLPAVSQPNSDQPLESVLQHEPTEMNQIDLSVTSVKRRYTIQRQSKLISLGLAVKRNRGFMDKIVSVVLDVSDVNSVENISKRHLRVLKSTDMVLVPV